MSLLIPDYVFDSIYEITPALLAASGVRGVLFDLDGTIASHKAALPPEALAPFFRTLTDAGYPVLVFSNNRDRRVAPFCRALDIAFISRAGKPLQRGFKRAAAQLGLEPSQLAIVGDQIFTDVFGGNRAGATTCYVQTLDRRYFWVNFRYQFERGFISRGQKRMKARGGHE